MNDIYLIICVVLTEHLCRFIFVPFEFPHVMIFSDMFALPRTCHLGAISCNVTRQANFSSAVRCKCVKPSPPHPHPQTLKSKQYIYKWWIQTVPPTNDDWHVVRCKYDVLYVASLSERRCSIQE